MFRVSCLGIWWHDIWKSQILKSDYEKSFRSEIKSIFPLSVVQSPPLPPYPLIHKRGWGKWNFPKMAVMGDGKFLKMERTRNGWFYNGKDGKFLISVYIVGRGPYIAYIFDTPIWIYIYTTCYVLTAATLITLYD